MRIRMKVDMSGTINGEPWPRIGEVADVPDVVAEKLVTAGHAEKPGRGKAKDEPTEVEEATPPAKNVETRPARTRKR